MIPWRVPTSEESNMILSKEKEEGIASGAIFSFAFIFILAALLLIGALFQSMSEDKRYHEILGYYIDNPPEFYEFDYYYFDYDLVEDYVDTNEIEDFMDIQIVGDLYNQINQSHEEAQDQYEKDKEEFYRLQELEIRNAKKQVREEISYKYYIYYVIVIILLVVGTVYLVKHQFKIYYMYKNKKYVVCDAICVDKKVEKKNYATRRPSYYFYVVVQTDDGSKHDVFVLKDFFDETELGKELLISGNKLSEDKDKIYGVYLPVR